MMRAPVLCGHRRQLHGDQPGQARTARPRRRVLRDQPAGTRLDNESLVENLAAQAEVVRSVRGFLGRLPVAVTPVTLKPRFNAVATGAETPPPPGELPRRVDPRQMSLFAAAGRSQPEVSVRERRGVGHLLRDHRLARRDGNRGRSPLPARFRSVAGGVFPLYHVLADAGEFAGGEVIASESNRPLAVDGMVLRKAERTRILLANLSEMVQQITLNASDLPGKVRMLILDETNAEEAMRSPESFRRAAGRPVEVTGRWLEVTLRPYALIRIDSMTS